MPNVPQLVNQLKPLRALCAVAATGSTVAAASALHLSQSSVVRAIQALEMDLAGALFERSARGMQPTPMGQELALRASRGLAHLAQADAPARRPASTDALAWVGSRLAAGVGQRLLALGQQGSVRFGGQVLPMRQRWGLG